MGAKSAAYWQGVEQFGEHVKTTNQVAELLGVSTGRVRHLAQHRNVGTKLMDGSRPIYLFTPRDVETLVNRRDERRRSG